MDVHVYVNTTQHQGILAGIWPCGIIVLVSKLFISESLSQVYGILHDFCQNNDVITCNLGKIILCVYTKTMLFTLKSIHLQFVTVYVKTRHMGYTRILHNARL